MNVQLFPSLHRVPIHVPPNIPVCVLYRSVVDDWLRSPEFVQGAVIHNLNGPMHKKFVGSAGIS